MVTEDFVILIVDLNQMQMKVFWKTGIPHVVLARSLALTDYDVGKTLQNMDVSCCDTGLVTGQMLNYKEGAIIHPFHALSAHRRVLMADPDSSLTMVHDFVMDILGYPNSCMMWVL